MLSSDVDADGIVNNVSAQHPGTNSPLISVPLCQTMFGVHHPGSGR